MPPLEPVWARGPVDGDPWPALPWADHIVHTLTANGHLPGSAIGKKIGLQLWTDCGGINSEMFAWAALRDEILRITGVDLSMYTCDLDAQSLDLAQRGRQPHHASKNVTQRNFTGGKGRSVWA